MFRVFLVATLAAAVLTDGAPPGSDLSSSPTAELTNAGSPSVRFAPVTDSAETAALEIEPLGQIADSERVLVDGVGFDLPAGWTTESVTIENGSGVQLSDGHNPVGSVTYADVGPADAYAVQSALDGATRAWEDAASGLRRVPLVWPGMPNAAALVFSLTDPSSGGAELDVIVAVAHATGRSGLVVVLISAPAGTLTTSPAYDVLRTIRFEGSTGGSTSEAGIYAVSYAIGGVVGTLVILGLVIWLIVWAIRRAQRKPPPAVGAP